MPPKQEMVLSKSREKPSRVEIRIATKYKIVTIVQTQQKFIRNIIVDCGNIDNVVYLSGKHYVVQCTRVVI